MPYLGGDVELPSSNGGCGDRRAYGIFVAIHFGGFNVPVAQLESGLDRCAALIALHAKGSLTESGTSMPCVAMLSLQGHS